VQVNVIPADVRLETYVRGKTVEAILEANTKVDRALKAGALALGAQVEIETLPGYLPMFNNLEMAEVFRVNAVALVGEGNYASIGHRTGSTDMGDISHVMPILHPYMGGASGMGHGANFQITDPQLAYLGPAKALARMAVDLLWGNAETARGILSRSRPRMTKADYLTFQRSINRRDLFDGTTLQSKLLS
jgi:metal-dependent amidase/aminoacylase/carboxypeptidase family protein